MQCIDGELLTQLQQGVATLRTLVLSRLKALLVTSGATGLTMLALGVALGASVHKAAYAIGGLLALSYLLVFVLMLDAREAVCTIFALLSINDAGSREEIVQQLNRCQKKQSSTVLPEGELDSILQQTLLEFPEKLRLNMAKALQIGPALAAAMSLCCFLGASLLVEDIPDEVYCLPVASSCLVAISLLCGIQVQMRASPLVRKLVLDDFGSPPLKLIEVQTLHLRKQVAATAEGLVH